jgi:hypothetical protein
MASLLDKGIVECNFKQQPKLKQTFLISPLCIQWVANRTEAAMATFTDSALNCTLASIRDKSDSRRKRDPTEEQSHLRYFRSLPPTVQEECWRQEDMTTNHPPL